MIFQINLILSPSERKIFILITLVRDIWGGSEEARRFAHDTHIPSILSTTGCLRFSLKMDFEVKTSR
jgi:hypothetical protein